MGIEFNGAALWIKSSDGQTMVADILNATCEMEPCPYETTPIHWNMSRTASFSCDIDYINLDMLNKLAVSPMPAVPFTLMHEKNIMIQARWHKKARVRKKWLKRYGMKPDIIHVVYDISELSYGHSDGNFDFETTYYRNVLRPDQKRRGLKIEL